MGSAPPGSGGPRGPGSPPRCRGASGCGRRLWPERATGPGGWCPKPAPRAPTDTAHARTSVGCRWGMGCLVPDPLRTAAYASRTTLGGVFPERLQPLVEATAELSDRFRSAGHSLYLVGGSVRDAIFADVASGGDEESRDLDFTTDARPEAIEAAVAGW